MHPGRQRAGHRAVAQAAGRFTGTAKKPASLPLKAPRIKKCGSGLARECGGSVNASSDCHTAFASKPAPTFVCAMPGYQSTQNIFQIYLAH
ncbi:hypothetical protein C0058_09535 [Pseudomonas sp. NC02]|nr:hypothetical protein C0058_09535 [Pseudomonas sp. NC02]